MQNGWNTFSEGGKKLQHLSPQSYTSRTLGWEKVGISVHSEEGVEIEVLRLMDVPPKSGRGKLKLLLHETCPELPVTGKAEKLLSRTLALGSLRTTDQDSKHS